MATITGSVTVGGVAHAVTAAVTLPGAVTPPPPPASGCLFGYWDPATNSGSMAPGLAKFSAAPVRSITEYIYWNMAFPAGINNFARQNGLTMYLNLEPWQGSATSNYPAMADIANGSSDAYLTALGSAIRAGGAVVWLTFAHEMNGSWYPWGIQNVSPAQWVKTWQHVVTMVNSTAGGLAKWVWCPNNNDVGPVTPYWPGAAFCDIPGFDGYLNTASQSQTFSSFIAPTVREIQKLTSQPVWNAETGVLGTNREARITQFVSDMHSAGLRGFAHWNEASYALGASELNALTSAVNAWNAS
jgi:beta-mannanase